ncbi:MAG: PBP1A family penicillin-binding protein [Bryobacteraceae bacterium]
MKVRVPAASGLARFALGPLGRFLIVGMALCGILAVGVFTFFYARYSRLIDEKLRAGPFANSARIFAAPESVAIGDAGSPEDIAARLRRSGYSDSRHNPVGSYQLHPNSIEIFPGPDSYFDQEAGVIKFAGGKIAQIVSLTDNTSRGEYQLEPQIITNVSGPSREKRRIVKFADIPRVLVDSVTSAEDKRFFQHAGFDPIRIIKAAYVDLKEGRKDQGASTLSMQLARMFWLDQGKRWTRKLAEVIITLQIEQKLSKEQIFEDYANQIYLGSRGTFRIHGFGEAAEVFLGKDLSQITLPEAAELASLPRWPAYFDPFRHPDHMRERRNLVLGLMRQNDLIGDRDYALAIEAPLTVAKSSAQSVDAPYFVDMVDDAIESKFQDVDLQSNAFRIYTTLDLRLQRAAGEAIRLGMQAVDEQIRRQRRFHGQTPPEAQVALVAIDPHTAEVKALAGGRNYGMSQLNHVLAKRQPGSIFKPFVYAAALNTGIEGGPHVLTASTQVLDEPTTFWFDGKPYEPSNFEGKFTHGAVTLRDALARSLNVPTVKVAETVGYDAVVEMANRAGMNYKIQPTPAVALGAYEITPLEAVGAYTVFANEGEYVKPSFVSLVRDQSGKAVYRNQIERARAIDPRLAYLMTNLLEEVLQHGTAEGVRARYNLDFPVAGKTGTSHDGWFAGYTSQLLCVVWVGFDDNRELDLEGAHSAAPIWAEFMKRAMQFREYRDTRPFESPGGIVSIKIDPQSGMPATPNCPTTRTEVYIAGTEPVGACPLHGGRYVTNVAGWETAPPAGQQEAAVPAQGVPPRVTGSGGDGVTPPPSSPPRSARRQSERVLIQSASPLPPAEQKEPRKKGFFQRLIGVFK